jgi:outer membrane protein TolC
MSASATLTQLIFNGTYLVGLQSAKVYQQISVSIKEKTTLAIRHAVTNTYAGILLTVEGINILNMNKATLEKTIHDTEEIYKNGFAEEQDVEQLQLTLATINNQLENLKRLKAYNINMLKYVMGIPIDDELFLTQNLEGLLLKNTDLSLTKKTFDYTQHIDFKIADNGKKANELQVKYEKSKYLPSLVGYINYGFSSYAEEFDFFKEEQSWYDSSVFGLSLNVPIFSSFQRNAKVQQAKIDFQKATRNLNETEQKLKLQHQTTLTSYQNALNSYQTAKASLALAERIENKESIKFFEGVSSSFALSNAQTQLYQQQQNYLQSIFELITTKAALESALGH